MSQNQVRFDCGKSADETRYINFCMHFVTHSANQIDQIDLEGLRQREMGQNLIFVVKFLYFIPISFHVNRRMTFENKTSEVQMLP